MTQQTFGVPYNSALATHYGEDAREWCNHWHTGQQVTFAFRKFTEGAAMWLAQ